MRRGPNCFMSALRHVRAEANVETIVEGDINGGRKAGFSIELMGKDLGRGAR